MLGKQRVQAASVIGESAGRVIAAVLVGVVVIAAAVAAVVALVVGRG